MYERHELELAFLDRPGVVHVVRVLVGLELSVPVAVEERDLVHVQALAALVDVDVVAPGRDVVASQIGRGAALEDRKLEVLSRRARPANRLEGDAGAGSLVALLARVRVAGRAGRGPLRRRSGIALLDIVAVAVELAGQASRAANVVFATEFAVDGSGPGAARVAVLLFVELAGGGVRYAFANATAGRRTDVLARWSTRPEPADTSLGYQAVALRGAGSARRNAAAGVAVGGRVGGTAAGCARPAGRRRNATVARATSRRDRQGTQGESSDQSHVHAPSRWPSLAESSGVRPPSREAAPGISTQKCGIPPGRLLRGTARY